MSFKINQSIHSLSIVASYLDPKEMIQLNGTSKIFYDYVIPMTMTMEQIYARTTKFKHIMNLIAELNYENAIKVLDIVMEDIEEDDCEGEWPKEISRITNKIDSDFFEINHTYFYGKEFNHWMYTKDHFHRQRCVMIYPRNIKISNFKRDSLI